MPGKKLTTLLQTFSNSELQQLRKYLLSPFFNENEVLVHLFDWMEANILHQKKRQQVTNKKAIWAILFPHQSYNDDKFRRLCSDLTQLAQNFLAYQMMEQNPITEKINYLSSLDSPKLEKHFSATVRSIGALQEKNQLLDGDYHLQRYQVETQTHRFYRFLGLKFTKLETLENADYQLDCFYISQKLRNYAVALAYKRILSQQADIYLFASFFESLENSHFLKEPAVLIYFSLVKMILEPEKEEYFKNLKKLLAKNHLHFTKNELNELYNHLSNYCIDTKINVGRSDYFYELFDIFKTLIQQDIIFKNNILDPQDYKNVITVGLYVKAFDWVEQFIQTYTARLPKDNQENALNYNLAKVYFNQKHYNKVIEQLREVEYKNPVYALGGKLMLLKTYYELEEVRALDSLIDSFRIYLRRNQLISKAVKQQYLNVLRFVKKLASVAPYDNKALAKIRVQIDKCKALADKKWILEKLETKER